MDEKLISTLRKFFACTVAAFEAHYSISKAFGYQGTISYMHLLHINAKNEIDKENPDPNIIDKYLAMMDTACHEPKDGFKFSKGGVIGEQKPDENGLTAKND